MLISLIAHETPVGLCGMWSAWWHPLIYQVSALLLGCFTERPTTLPEGSAVNPSISSSDAIKWLEGPGGVLSKQQSKQSRMEQRYRKRKANKCHLRGLLMFRTALIQRCRLLQRFWNLIANYEPRLKHEEAARLYAEAAGACTHSHTLTQQHTRTRSD